jgi:hypothetical protein
MVSMESSQGEEENGDLHLAFDARFGGDWEMKE